MKKRTRTYHLLAGSLVALALISVRAQAETPESEWGDLGYSHPEEAHPQQVEELAANNDDIADAPAPMADAKSDAVDNDEIATTISSADLAAAPEAHTRSATDIGTIQNTYGVETEERKPITLYAAPLFGITSMLGNDTVDSSPKYAAGVSAGLLLGNNFLVQATYAHEESALSNPTINNTGVQFLGSNAFALKQNSFSLGGRFFILGRESRIRPFVGGGASYVRSSLTYDDAFIGVLSSRSVTNSNDLTLSQYQGFGELGAEVAITRSIVAQASFQVSGVLSSSFTNDTSVDSTRSAVADSVGRTASYMASVGLGIYF